ncbi:N-acetyltransferase family protein [Amycolatopsis acidiphila]|uniref:N-acetyltransferase n=1 Tax=Amycolatopsis acidiphila TaxID=715473 RepID=A0A558A2K7_9PSEU|nr:GNAT family N-acetyltransferase [Amycolatopsis acidiphila]TVT18488.1 N-acetyltransferase [Amycolatopsis acidiphila]UIJ59999.1 N-acetyltransferase family protein [Amycolatopsis acidiphila]GHG61955.1 N-acetyltransferase [Amycolatopsis acidiphila]
MKTATEADLPAIAEIYAHYVERSVATFELVAPDETEWKQRFAAVTGAGLPFLVARDADAVVGYAYCSPWKTRPAYRHTVEDSIYLAPAAAGRGIGGLLLDELLARCAAAGIREVIAVIADPGPANASPFLHRRRGFAEAGRLTGVGFKHGRRLDTLLMQRSLTVPD